MRITVAGVGYVGLSLAVLLALVCWKKWKSMTNDEKKLIQAKHRLEQAENRNRKKERTERNHRLIVEGAILEKLLPEIKTMNLTEIEGYLRNRLN